MFGFPCCSTREDLSINVSITNVGLILTKLGGFLFSGYGQMDGRTDIVFEKRTVFFQTMFYIVEKKTVFYQDFFFFFSFFFQNFFLMSLFYF